jgi:hypothetical protein
MGLDQQARLFFPTPQAADGKMVKGGKRGQQENPSLGTVAQSMFPTPKERDHRTPTKRSRFGRTGSTKAEDLECFVEHSLPDQVTPAGPQSLPAVQTSRRRLNPRFVEWLMGFPVSWTEL